MDIIVVKAKIIESEERLAKFLASWSTSSALRPRGFHPSLEHTQMNALHVDTETLGFPTGYFSIRSVATGRLLEIYKNATDDGSPLALWPAKEQSLVESTSVRPVDLS